MNKGSIVERLCSDLDRKEPRYKSPTLLYFTLLLPHSSHRDLLYSVSLQNSNQVDANGNSVEIKY